MRFDARRAFFGLVLSACLPTAAAHTIPNDVTVQLMLKPEGRHLLLLARIPMAAVRDIAFPVRGEQNYLDIAASRPLLAEAAMLSIADAMPVYEDGVALPKPRITAAQISLLSDRSFISWDQAYAHVTGQPLAGDATTFATQSFLDALFEYPIVSERARFSLDPGGISYLGVRTVTVLRFLPPNGAVRAFEFEGNPGLTYLDPRWYQAAARFVRMGFLHIPDGADHLLFLFCLVVPFRKFRELIPVITSFTVAHSITLLASAYGYAPGFAWFPPLIELLIAVSIFYMAIENIAAAMDGDGRAGGRRWAIAFGFGLVHGFGFSWTLRETLQFAGSHLLGSLLSFNLGVELGQLVVLALLIPALDFLFRFVMKEKTGVIILSAIAADIGGHWVVERWDNLRKLNLGWPELTPSLLLSIVRWIAAGVVVWGLWRVAIDFHRRTVSRRARAPISSSAD